jgi:ABC-type dipeptide/oligopeptide/nickel transport system permease subunit
MKHFGYILKSKTFVIGFIMVISVAMVAVFADKIAPYGYDEVNMSAPLRAPGDGYLWGTDQLGRDLFSRVIYGSRIALMVAAVSVVLETAIGVTVGLLGGFFGGKIDKILSFFTDLTWAMPPIIMALAVITIIGPGLNNVIAAIAIVSWAQFARVVRAKTQSLKNLPFVEAGIAIGENKITLMVRYILPNIIPSIIVIATILIPGAIMSTTALGFLGLGAQPPSPDWGVSLSEGTAFIAEAPWLGIYPGIALTYTVLAFNLLGEGLRDVLDPRLKL